MPRARSAKGSRYVPGFMSRVASCSTLAPRGGEPVQVGRHRAEVEPVRPPHRRLAEQGLGGRQVAALKGELQARCRARFRNRSCRGPPPRVRVGGPPRRRRGARERVRTRAKSADFARTASRRLRPRRLPPAAAAGWRLPSCRGAPRARGWLKRRAVDGEASPRVTSSLEAA